VKSMVSLVRFQLQALGLRSQVIKAVACKATYRQFKSVRSLHSEIAQLAEQDSDIVKVVGSNPTLRTILPCSST
jgi:hypothetical protein